MAKRQFSTSMPLHEIYPRLLRYTWRHKWWLIMAAITMAAASGGDVLLVYMIKPLLDGSIVNRDPFLIQWIPIFIIGIFVVRGIFEFLARYCRKYASTIIVFDIRNELFDKFLVLPTSYFDKHSTGKATAKLTFYTEQVASAATDSLKTITEDGFRVVGFLGLMFFMDWKLSLITIAVAPIIVVLTAYISKRFRRYSDRIQRTIGSITQLSEEVLHGQRTVKIFGGHDREQQKFRDANKYHRKMTLRKATTKAASVPIMQIISSLAIAMVVGVALRGTGDGVMSPGELGSFFGAMMSLMSPLKRLTGVNEEIQTGMAAAGAIFELLDAHEEVNLGQGQTRELKGALTFNHLNFSYPQTARQVLFDINLDIPAGQTFAFVGHSGSGKSTLLSLIPRFYDCEAGAILLDGRPLESYSLVELRRQIALVDQNLTLFDDTITNNIAYGDLKHAPQQAIENAAKLAFAHDFISQLENGYDTVVGQNGTLLSGGQRQRIAIARAILKDAPILILDEATSALDTQSERAIQKGLDNLMQNRTTLVIAHRLSTIRDADKIVVLDAGHIVESGTHDELFNLQGHYRHLYDLQLSKKA